MVQRYEAIGATTKSPGAAPPVTAKPLSVPMENGRPGTVTAPSVAKGSQMNGRSGVSLPVPDDSTSTSRNNSKNLPRTSPVGFPRTSPLLEKDDGKESTPRPRRSSHRPDSSTAVFPVRKSTTEDPSMRAGDARSPSPERPYQGVGKLIDQWQKKSVESEPPRGSPVNKRGGFVAKRAGLVSGGITRGQ